MHGTHIGLLTQLRGKLLRTTIDVPLVVTLILSTLIAADLVHLASVLSGHRPPNALPPPSIGTTVRFGANVASIVRAHLFGIALPERIKNDPANAPGSGANLVLAGTVATEDPKYGFAIIAEGGPSKVYSVGDQIGGASLHSVYLDHVILNRDGSFESLYLPHKLLLGSRVSVARAAKPSGPPIMVDNQNRVVDKPPGVLDSVLRTVSVAGDGPNPSGFRVYPVPGGPALTALGLVPGDLVTAINGTPVDDPRRGPEIFNSLNSSDAPTVTVVRQGQTLNVVLNVGSAVVDADNARLNASKADASVN